MISGRSATLLLILLPVCVPLVSADQRIFTRHTGRNVTVEFPVPNSTSSVWLKRPGSDKYLFYCRDGHPTRPEDQESSFKDRVEVTDCGRINGTISVTVSNLIPSDSGPYEFHCGDRDETIFLNVTDPDQRIFTRHTGRNVTVEFPVPTDTTSIWLKRPGSDKYLFYCRDGHPTRPEDQESSFKDRVEVTNCGRINGTISVTVSNLTLSDSGLYEFHCGDGDGFNETIFLDVTDPGRTGGGHVGVIVGVSLFSAGLLVVVVGVCIGLKIYRPCRKQHGPDPKVPDEEQALDSHDRHLQTCEEKLLMKMP